MAKKGGRNTSCSVSNIDGGGKLTYSKEKEDKCRRSFLTELRKFFDNADILKISPADVPFLARRVENAIYSKMIDKKKYEVVMSRV